MFWGWDKMMPLSSWYIYIYIYLKLIILYGIDLLFFFFIFNLSAFLNFHTEIYCIIVSSCTERGSNAVHRMTSLLLGNVFPNAAPMCGPWVTVGCLHKGPVIQRCTCPRLIPFALFLLLTSVKRHPYPITNCQWLSFVLAMCILA